MTFQASGALSLNLSILGHTVERTAPVVPMYSPLWYATRLMATTANSWWEGGVPPARRRGQRAADAVVHAATGVARRLHVVRTTASR